MILEKVKFVLWGPPNSGKSWLVEAFAQSLKKLHREFSKLNTELSILVTDKNGKQVRPQLPLPFSSEELNVNRYYLKRELTSSSWNRFSTQINMHQHEISLVDNSGRNLSYSADPYRTEKEKNLFDQAQHILKSNSTKCILLALDTGSITPEQYVKDLKALRDLLDESPRYIAACITKGDEIGLFDDDDQEAILIGRFGSKFANDICYLLTEELPSDGHSVEIFTTSSVGYYRTENGKCFPNIKKEKEGQNNIPQLASEVDWQPIHVEKPFFWLLQNIEQRKIEELKKERPKLFQIIFPNSEKRDYWTYDQIIELIPDQLPCSDTDLGGIIHADKLIAQDYLSLYEGLRQSFTNDEIRGVCFHLEIDPDEFRHNIKNTFIIDLILYCQRRHRVEELRTTVKELRPHLTI